MTQGKISLSILRLEELKDFKHCNTGVDFKF